MKPSCPDCQRENEPQRIYCHDCGAKLDRTKLINEVRKEELPQDTHKRLKAMFNPQGVILRRNFFRVSKVVLAALVTAALIQMFLSPDVPVKTKSVGLSSIGLDLEKASSRSGGQPLNYTEEQVNAYLLSSLKSKQVALSGWTTFVQATVRLEENLCRLSVERSLYGLPIFTSAAYEAAVLNGVVIGTARSASIGRLPVHPKLIGYLAPVFSDVFGALERDRKSLVKMGGIEFHPQSVTILPKP